MTHPPLLSVLPDRVWRVRVWIRILAVLLGAWCLVLLALVADERRRGVWDEGGLLIVVVLAAVAVGVPTLALYPQLRLHSDGRISMRGLLGRRDVRVDDIRAVYLTSSGLRFEFTSANPFTCIIFQATRSFDQPRYFEVIEALTGVRPKAEPAWILPSSPTDEHATPADFRTVLQSLADFATEIAGPTAKVTPLDDPDHLPGLAIAPAGGAGQTVLVYAGDALLVSVGRGRWQFGYDAESLALTRSVIRAVVAGRGRRTSAFGRSATELDRPGEHQLVSVTYETWLAPLVPQPGWRQWGRRVEFVPYASPASER